MRVAVVGASSLRGKELKQVLEDRNFPARDIVLLDDTVMAGTLTEAAGEATFIRALEEDSFEGARFVFFAGTVDDTQRNWQAAQRAGATVIDLTGAIAQLPNAVSWIPALDAQFPPQGSRAYAYSSPSTPVLSACFLSAAAMEFKPRRIVILFFPPVSEHDQQGIEELESQTASLLSFRPIAQEVFDAQVAFNLLASYGPISKKSLESHRTLISKGVESYVAGRCLVPAIQVVQAPVFYGYSFAAYMDFDPPVAGGQLESALAKLGVKVTASGDPAPSNITTAGENQIHLAPISADPAVPTAIWLWGVADNLRLAAVNAVQIAEKLIAH